MIVGLNVTALLMGRRKPSWWCRLAHRRFLTRADTVCLKCLARFVNARR